VPLILSKLGEGGLFNMVSEARHEFGLGEQDPAWQTAARYIVGWADEALNEYKAARTSATT
jgi:hypothetical protein